MNRMKYAWIFIVVLFVFSCTKNYPCRKESFEVYLKGYTASEADTIIIKRYQTGTNFTVYTDSIVLAYSPLFQNSSDSAYRFYKHSMVENYDYKVIIPSDNKTVAVSDIKFEMNERVSNGCGKPIECESPLISYKRDGTLLSRGTSTDFHKLIITK